MRAATFIAAALALGAAPAAAQEIHVDPSIRVKVLKPGTYVHRCGDKGSCPIDRYLRMVELRWGDGCTLSDGARHHWEVGLRSAVRPGSRRDPETFAGTPAIVDGAYAPVVRPKKATVSAQDPVFQEFPDALAAFADGVPAGRSKLRMGVLPGSVIAAHLGASCSSSGDESEFIGVDSTVVTVRPRADVAGYPRLHPGRATQIAFDLSRNASSLIRTTGRGPSGAVLRVSGSGIRTRRALTAPDVRNGQTWIRVRPSERGTVHAWISLSGVRSYNTVSLRSR